LPHADSSEMVDDPVDPVPEETVAGPATPPDDDLHVHVSRRALRRAGLVALALLIALGGLGAGLLLAGGGEGDAGTDERARGRRRAPTSTTTTTTPPPADAAAVAGAAEAADAGSGGGTAGVDADGGSSAASGEGAPAAGAEPAPPPPAAEPEPPPEPTIVLNLEANTFNCSNIFPTMTVEWLTANASLVELSIDNGPYIPHFSVNGSVPAKVDCGRPIVVRARATDDLGRVAFTSAVRTIA
jgi:hypothetical protein